MTAGILSHRPAACKALTTTGLKASKRVGAGNIGELVPSRTTDDLCFANLETQGN
ncbi:MAG: hypothetical protein IIC01_09540 [Planctomycetes bacterium]|nr:hypothetical protein [Planctomycetota bacterium]